MKLIDDLHMINDDLYKKLLSFYNDARVLDRFYIPTRYPNGLPDITPSQAYSEEDAVMGLSIADRFISFIRDEILV